MNKPDLERKKRIALVVILAACVLAAVIIGVILTRPTVPELPF